MSLPVKLVSNLCLLIHILYMLLRYYKLVLFFSNYKEKNTHKIKDPRKVDDELWPLVCCMNRGNAQSKKMGTKHTSQCETQTADCRLRTRGKMQTECKMQTAD